MKQVKEGDTVKVHYTGKMDDGNVFDSSLNRDPLEFKIGEGNIIPGFEKGVVGMEVGATKTLTLPSEEAYGPRLKELEISVNKTELPQGLDPSVGQQLQIQTPDGGVGSVIVKKVEEETITIDANHPLAGETLTFDIEVMEIS